MVATEHSDHTSRARLVLLGIKGRLPRLWNDEPTKTAATCSKLQDLPLDAVRKVPTTAWLSPD
eukprot:3009774-Heterocapsa_arctica.AAC.1